MWIFVPAAARVRNQSLSGGRRGASDPLCGLYHPLQRCSSLVPNHTVISEVRWMWGVSGSAQLFWAFSWNGARAVLWVGLVRSVEMCRPGPGQTVSPIIYFIVPIYNIYGEKQYSAAGATFLKPMSFVVFPLFRTRTENHSNCVQKLNISITN